MIKKNKNLLIISGLLGLFLSVTFAQNSYAVTASEWRAGNIIDDVIFTNKSSMSVDQIQSFLNNKVGTGTNGVPGQCDTYGTRMSEWSGYSITRAQYGINMGKPGPFTCLKDYYEVPKTEPSPGIPANNYGGKPIPAGAKSAAQLIWDAAQRYDISPKVLLVKLGTESAGPLTSDDWPFLSQYTYAMGSHCPDSGPNGTANCDSNYAGFSIQMDSAASLLRWYMDNMTQSWWPYKKPYQNNAIHWNVVERGCGTSNVYIENKATAALYTYTPYQPNQAALNNMYGTGDSCSAYGNRNFWRTFNDWFGSTRNIINNGILIRSIDSKDVFKIENNKKRHIPNELIFNSYSYRWSDVVLVNPYEISSIPIGTPMPYFGIHNRDGQLVRATFDSDGIYIIENGTKRAFPSAEVFLSYSYNSADSVVIGTAEFNLIPNGLTMIASNPHNRDGQLIKVLGTTGVYLVDNGTKRAFPDGLTFSSYSYKWADIHDVSLQEFNLIPNGSLMTKRSS